VDLKHITHLHFCLADVAQCLHRAIGAYHTVDTGLAAITPSAPYSALVMQLDVSTLLATTDAGGLGLSMEPAGMMTLMGLRHPARQRRGEEEHHIRHLLRPAHAAEARRIDQGRRGSPRGK